MSDEKTALFADSEINKIMYCGCISFLVGKEEVRARFEKETGTPPIRIPKTGIDALVDDACGVGVKDYFKKFIPWATVTYWDGDGDMTPSNYMTEIFNFGEEESK